MPIKLLKNTSLFLIALLFNCGNTASDERIVSTPGGDPAITEYAGTLPLDKIKLPAGFKIEVYAEVKNARSMAMSPAGVLYVGNRNDDKVYAVKDTDGDMVADKRWVIASGLNMPNGVAFKDGDLYVAEVSRVTK